MSETAMSNKEIEEEQERKLKERLAGKTVNEKKRTTLIKERKAYFDSADYNMKGKVENPNKKTIPNSVKKGELIASARHLSPAQTDEDTHLKETTHSGDASAQDDEEEEEEQ
ncbi:ABCA5 [Acrasis kona]|uniref:ABCA5 n=1 Tax=Acrasis kona TaxID=1008807 RepID=A0AAW2Z9Q7_9EUKA